MLVVLHNAICVVIWCIVIAANLFQLPTSVYVCFFVLLSILLAQHYFLGICILSSIEKRVNGAPYRFAEPFMEFFSIPVTVESTRGFTVLIISLVLGFSALHLLHTWIQRA
jgi:hypothetical protein